MQMEGEDMRREDNTAAGEEETTITTNTEVSINKFKYSLYLSLCPPDVLTRGLNLHQGCRHQYGSGVEKGEQRLYRFVL